MNYFAVHLRDRRYVVCYGAGHQIGYGRSQLEALMDAVRRLEKGDLPRNLIHLHKKWVS